ncbi:MAG: hypothetical protein PHQ18_05185 [Patescibacteria group bacterium]|nr:hypothetical protein [Patescibacteria group bacterium]
MENEEQINRKFMFWLMWGIFSVSVIIYGVVIYILSSVETQAENVDVSILKNIFYVLSLMSAFVSVFVVDIFFKRKLNMPKQNETNETLSEDEILQLYFPYFLKKIMFAVSIASFGFVLAIMSNDGMNIYLPFGVFSILILLLNIPKLDNLAN